ncbi:MAG: tape measure protein [Moraxellaceae bacterium]|nr:tape measure protein [Moraxellaceae bacterium]
MRLFTFGQALSGNFSAAGQELNSIIEQAPALADAIAKSYGVTRGELKKLGEAGIITASGVVNGLIRQGNEVDGLFGQINNTIGGTATTAEALKLMIVEMDKAIGLSDAMIDALVLIRDHTAELKLVLELAGAALLGAFSLAVVTQIGGIIAAIGAGLTVSLIGLVIQARIAGTSLLAAFGARLWAAIATTNIALVSLRGLIASFAFILAALAIGEYLFNQNIEVRLFVLDFVKTWLEIGEKLKGFFVQWGLSLEYTFINAVNVIRLNLSKLIVYIAGVIDKLNPFGDSLRNALLDFAKLVAPKGDAFAEYNANMDAVRANVENNVKSIGQQYDALAQMEIDNEYNKKEEVADEDLVQVTNKPKPVN